MFHIRVFKRVQDNEESVSENRINQFFEIHEKEMEG
jgi:hypothetical protein